jgi:hypothetical protein
MNFDCRVQAGYCSQLILVIVGLLSKKRDESIQIRQGNADYSPINAIGIGDLIAPLANPYSPRRRQLCANATIVIVDVIFKFLLSANEGIPLFNDLRVEHIHEDDAQCLCRRLIYTFSFGSTVAPSICPFSSSRVRSSAGLIVKLDRFVKTNFIRLSVTTKRKRARRLS